MIRLQPPLPERYTAVPPDQLATRIGTARAALGGRAMILGHHYQRDEVMRWADCRGPRHRPSFSDSERRPERCEAPATWPVRLP